MHAKAKPPVSRAPVSSFGFSTRRRAGCVVLLVPRRSSRSPLTDLTDCLGEMWPNGSSGARLVVGGRGHHLGPTASSGSGSICSAFDGWSAKPWSSPSSPPPAGDVETWKLRQALESSMDGGVWCRPSMHTVRRGPVDDGQEVISRGRVSGKSCTVASWWRAACP